MNHLRIDADASGHWQWKRENFTTHKKAYHIETKLDLTRGAINELYNQIEMQKTIINKLCHELGIAEVL